MIDEQDGTAVGDLEDDFELKEELGRGGSAVVYLARDKALGRDVAIKVVRSRLAGVTDDSIARLDREAKTVAKLEHENIVKVFTVKKLRDGGLALVMQLVPGKTLKQTIVDRGALPAAEAEKIIFDVAKALAFAHSQGVVHRDVKPENIFINSLTGRAMLSDFGIAHSNEDSRLTMTGAAIGTPAYMSPEQIDGAPANARSDVYSLGLVAWEMLTGERPWEGETLYNVIFKQKHEQLPSVDELRPGEVPPRLQYIIERMLQKKPAARWVNAEALMKILSTWVQPADWRQWEDAHQRRRDSLKAAAKGKTPASVAPVLSTSMATVRFPRSGAGATTPSSEPIVIPANFDRRTPAEVGLAGDDEEDDAPSWAVNAPPPSHFKRNALIGVALLFVVAGSVAGLAYRAGRIHLPEAWSTRFADAPKPTIVAAAPPAKPADTISTFTRDSISLARITDSLTAVALAQMPVAGSGVSAGTLTTDKPAPSTVAVVPGPNPTTSNGAVVNASATNPTTTTGSGRGTAIPSSAAAVPAKPVAPDVPTPSVRATDDRGTIAAGGRHSCVLSTTRVLCWGGNDRGQLGDGESESRDTPAGIVLDLEFAQISAGFAHSCGVTRGGDAYCWGWDERGQLGDATTTSRNAPVRVAGSLSFQLVRAGQNHTCGLTTSSEIACWGLNDKGQLGDNTTANHYSPVTLKLSMRFISLSVGWSHTCAISFDGAAYCWGDNASGQLGDGSHSDRKLPEPVAGGLRFTSIAAGSKHTCAVTESGEAYCWGKNANGQLGVGNSTDQSAPARVETTARFASVSTGGVHSCARVRAGQLWCWGQNIYGQLGDGTTVNRDTPVRVVGGIAFASVSAMGAHTCGTSVDGETSCWGYNTEGQLGDGTRNHHSRPMRITLPGR